MKITLERSPEGGFDVWQRPRGQRPSVIAHHDLLWAARNDARREASDRGWQLVSRVDDLQPSAAL